MCSRAQWNHPAVRKNEGHTNQEKPEKHGGNQGSQSSNSVTPHTTHSERNENGWTQRDVQTSWVGGREHPSMAGQVSALAGTGYMNTDVWLGSINHILRIYASSYVKSPSSAWFSLVEINKLIPDSVETAETENTEAGWKSTAGQPHSQTRGCHSCAVQKHTP